MTTRPIRNNLRRVLNQLSEGSPLKETNTVEKLDNYLKHRVPELAKAKQTPRVAIDPLEKGHLILMPKYSSKADLAILKNDANRAERAGRLNEARLLWRRVLAVDGTDSDAIDAIVDLGRKIRTTPQSNISIGKDPQEGLRREVLQDRQEESHSLTLDCGNGVTLDLVKIPARSFTMGMPPEERKIALANALQYGANREDVEKLLDLSTPQHQVELQAFWMGKHAVTNAQWQAVMSIKPSEQYDHKFQGNKQPIVGVSWHDARAFCQKISEKVRLEVRLPTEAEWEYACRAGTTTPFAFGETITTDLVNYNGNYPYGSAPQGECRDRTVDVDSFSPNAWSLYQMHGNVWEWCLDEWHDYSDKPDRLKNHGTETWGNLNVDENDNRYLLLRGGSWLNDARNCRSAYRDWYNARDSYPDVGFRVVVSSSLRGGV
jgi:formylglycine-generating enzyme required for sulfatase activity